MPGEDTTQEIFAAARNAIERRVNEIRQVCGKDFDIDYIDYIDYGGELTVSLASGETSQGNMPLSFELEPKLIYRLYTLDRLNLALEHEVLAPQWAEVFDSDMQSRAARNLATADRLAHLDGVLQGGGSADSEVAITHDPLLVVGKRVTWAYEGRFSVANAETRCEYIHRTA